MECIQGVVTRREVVRLYYNRKQWVGCQDTRHKLWKGDAHLDFCSDQGGQRWTSEVQQRTSEWQACLSCFQNYLYVSVMREAQLLPTTSILSDLTVTRKAAASTRGLVKLWIAAVPNQCIPPSRKHQRLRAMVRMEGFCRATLENARSQHRRYCNITLKTNRAL